MRLKIEDLEFKIASFLGTGYSVYTLGALINSDFYSIGQQASYLVGGSAVAFIYVKKIVQPLISMDSWKGVILASLPFVTSWYLIATPTYERMVNTFTDHHYLEYKKEASKLEKASDKVQDLTMNVKMKKASVKKIDRSELFSLQINKEKELSKIRNIVQQKRAEWKESRFKNTTDYDAYKKEYKKRFGDFGNGKIAINNFTRMLYENKVKSLKEKFDLEDKINIGSIVSTTDDLLIEKANIDKKRYKTLLKNIAEIEKKTTIKLPVFEKIMILFGIFLEVFLTHASYWMRKLTPKEVLKVMKETAEKDEVFTKEKKFLEVADLHPNHKLNSLFAVMRCYAHGEKLTEKNIEKFSYFTNFNTNRKYKTGKVGLRAKRHLDEYGFLDDDGNIIDIVLLRDVIKEFVG